MRAWRRNVGLVTGKPVHTVLEILPSDHRRSLEGSHRPLIRVRDRDIYLQLRTFFEHYGCSLRLSEKGVRKVARAVNRYDGPTDRSSQKNRLSSVLPGG